MLSQILISIFRPLFVTSVFSLSNKESKVKVCISIVSIVSFEWVILTCYGIQDSKQHVFSTGNLSFWFVQYDEAIYLNDV